MDIITSRIFQNYPEIIFGLSTKSGVETNSPFGFNLSLTVGDDPERVISNREIFFNELGLTSAKVAIQKQVHSGIVTIVENAGMIGESDAMITSRPGIGLAISTADCVPVFVYDRFNKVIAGIHSGWRGTREKIVLKTLESMRNRFNSNPADLVIFVGPSISQKNYEVGSEVALQFDRRYSVNSGSGIYLDVLQANIDMIRKFGVAYDRMEISPLCSYDEKELLHSHRRDGKFSGRSLGVIAMAER